MIRTASISLGLIVLLALSAAVLYLLFWSVRKFVYPLIKIRRIQRLTEIWLFRAELIGWSLYGAFSLYQLLYASPFITLVLLVLIYLLGLPFWKDFVPGLLFRLENQVTIGDSIRIDGQESNVEALGPRNLASSNAAGETIITPYHKLNDAVLVRARAEGKLIKQTFTVRFPKKDDPKGADHIRQFLLDCPWSVPLQVPTVKHLGDGEYQVTAFAADKYAAERQKAYLLWRISEIQ